jgi:hypothetical protein
MNTYTDTQLKHALAKMLPEKLGLSPSGVLSWLTLQGNDYVLDTELLHLCWLVEEALEDEQILDYVRILLEDVLQCFQGKFRQHFALTHATWQQRTIALCKVKGVEI